MSKLPLLFSAIVLTASCAPKKASNDTVKSAYIHKYGVEVPDAADFISRGATGEVVSTQKNGVVARENYMENKLHGLSSWTFPHSVTIECTRLYDHGNLVEETKNYLTGSPKQKTVFHQNGILITSWYEDGTPRATEQFILSNLIGGEYFTLAHELEATVKDGQGTRIIRDGMGELIVKETFNSGVLTLQETYYPSGAPFAVIPYVNNKVQGVKKTFYPGGEPKTVENWIDGEQNGTTYVYQNGECVAKISYHHGLKNGIETLFKAGTTAAAEEISWVDGKRHGPSILYFDNTKLTDWYFENEKVSKLQFIELGSEAESGQYARD